MRIDGVSSLPKIDLIPNEQGAALPVPGASGGVEKSFGQFLLDALGEVNAAQQNAGGMVKRFATGEPMDVHQVMIAMEQAGTSLALTMQLRNKLVDAYQEIIRTQV